MEIKFFSFRTKIAVLFGGMMVLVLGVFAGITLWSIDQVAESRVQKGIHEAEAAFREVRASIETSARDSVNTLAASNPEVRAVLGSFSAPSDAELFGKSDPSDPGSTKILDAHNILGSSIPFLPVFSRSPVFAVLDSQGRLLLDKQNLGNFGQSLSSLSLIQDALANDSAYGWWSPSDESLNDLGLLPSHPKDAIYQILGVPVSVSGKKEGILLVGTAMNDDFLSQLERATRAQISVFRDGKIRISAFAKERLQELEKVLRIQTPDVLVRFTLGEEKYLGTFVGLSRDSTSRGALQTDGFLIARSKTEELAPYSLLQLQLKALVALALLIAAAAAFLAARWVSRPLATLSAAMAEIGRGNLAHRVAVSSGDEFEGLGDLFNSMTAGLEEREKIRNTFKSFVSEHVVNLLLGNTEGIKLGGEKRDISAFFSDIASFTSHAEKMGPEMSVAFLNEYLTAMTEIIEEQGGLVDKYIGDGIMAFWGAPILSQDHPDRACRTAIAQVQKMDQTFESWRNKYNLSHLSIRIGIDSGKAIVGNIGSTHRMNYTIVGDTVNLASRLEGLNKAYGTRICISQATRSQLNSTFAVRELDLVKIRGMKMVIHVYELMGYNGQNPDLEALVPRYEEALSLFRARKFGEAEKLFDQCRIQGVLDSPSHTLIRRCQIYKNNPPDPSWDGVWVPVNQ